jgi:hypothetical protein
VREKGLAHMVSEIFFIIELLWKESFKDSEGMVIEHFFINELLKKWLMQSIDVIDNHAIAQVEVIWYEHVEGRTRERVRESLNT